MLHRFPPPRSPLPNMKLAQHLSLLQMCLVIRLILAESLIFSLCFLYYILSSMWDLFKISYFGFIWEDNYFLTMCFQCVPPYTPSSSLARLFLVASPLSAHAPNPEDCPEENKLVYEWHWWSKWVLVFRRNIYPIFCWFSQALSVFIFKKNMKTNKKT